MIGGLAIAGVLVLGGLILGFCLYEVTWKQHRLRRDLDGLRDLGGQLTALQQQLDVTRVRLARRGR